MQINSKFPEKLDNIVIQHPAYRQGLENLERCYRNVAANRGAKSIAVIGESGTGKSKLLRSLLDNHPFQQFETHKVCPIIYFELMWKPTPRKIYQEILNVIGDDNWHKGTEAELRKRCFTLLANCQTLLILIDEYQRLIERNSKKVIYDVSELIKEFINKGIGVVVAGITGSEKIFESDSQLKRRMMSSIFLKRFDYKDKQQRIEFTSILKAYDNYIKNFCTMDINLQDYSDNFYCATGGIIGYLTTIIDHALLTALEKKCHFNLELLSSAWILNVNDHVIWNGVDVFSSNFNISNHHDFLIKAKAVGQENRNLDFNA